MYKKYVKRLIDIVLSLVGMIVLLPVFVVIGVRTDTNLRV